MTATPDLERESRNLVEEYLQRDILAPETADRVERLHTQGKAGDALEVILRERRNRPGDESGATPVGRR